MSQHRDFDHFSIVPFKAICGADVPNQSTTQIPERAKCVTCWQYWREWESTRAAQKAVADLAPVAQPPIAEMEIASQSRAANTPYAVKEFVERVWALTQDRDGWSKVTLGGLTERLIRGLVTTAQQRGSELQREVDAKLAESWEHEDKVNPARWIANAIRAAKQQ